MIIFYIISILIIQIRILKESMMIIFSGLVMGFLAIYMAIVLIFPDKF